MEEYEDEIWLAYVEPQYENEYAKMVAAQKSRTAASYLSKKAEAQIENQRNQMRQHLKKMNPNVEIP